MAYGMYCAFRYVHPSLYSYASTATDIASVKIKYEEGFMAIPNTTMIITASILHEVMTMFQNNELIVTHIQKPEQFWTSADQQLVIPTNYSLCVGFSFQT